MKAPCAGTTLRIASMTRRRKLARDPGCTTCSCAATMPSPRLAAAPAVPVVAAMTLAATSDALSRGRSTEFLPERRVAESYTSAMTDHATEADRAAQFIFD